MRFMNEDDQKFVDIGEGLLNHALRYCIPSSVFDLGCGYGRLAYALHRRRFGGRYVGMDILPKQINWLRETFTDPSYEFRHLDVHNARYNQKGALRVEDVDFDLEFLPDLILILSVFTHLYESDIEVYLKKLRAIVSERSVVFATFFILTGDTRRRPYNFGHNLNDHCSYFNAEDPLHAIAYDETWLREMFVRVGFACKSIDYGYQDTVVLAAA